MVKCSRCGFDLTSPSACTNCGTTAGQKQQKKGRHLLLRKYGIATHPFQATLASQLSFDTAEIFQLHQEIDDNWFQATSVEYNTNGLVPKTHIALLPETSEIYKRYCGDENAPIKKTEKKRSSLAMIKYSSNNFFYSTYNNILYQIFVFLNLNEMYKCLFVSKTWSKMALKSLLSTHKTKLENLKNQKKTEKKEERDAQIQRVRIWRDDPFCILMQPFPILTDHNINLTDLFNVNICVLGAQKSGKSSLIQSLNSKFDSNYVASTKNELIQKQEKIDGENVSFQIVDTGSNKEEQDQAIMKSNFFLILYSIDDKASFAQAEKIYKEILLIHSQKPFVPSFLVGCKADLAESNRVVSFDDGLTLSKSLKLDGFFECSSKSGFSVSSIFDNAARAYSLSLILTEKNSSTETSAPSSPSLPSVNNIIKKVSLQQTPQVSKTENVENSKCFIF